MTSKKNKFDICPLKKQTNLIIIVIVTNEETSPTVAHCLSSYYGYDRDSVILGNP